jgi:guanidinopropionase
MTKSVQMDREKSLSKFTGLATYFGFPFREEDWSDIDVGLIGVPYDGAVTNRAGARHGPREMRNYSTFLRSVNQGSGIDLRELGVIADLGDAAIDHMYEVEAAHKDIECFYQRVVDNGIVPVSAGGDHSITLPILRALAKHQPVNMVHFDAHCDTGDEFSGSRFHHGAPFYHAVEEGLVNPKKSIQIGIRGTLSDADTWKYSHDVGMRVVYMEEFHKSGYQAVIEEARALVGDGPTYITFDVDGLDPVFAPGTGTPEIGGFTSIEAQLMIRGLRGLNLVGGDVVEVAPPFDQTGSTSLLGASMMYEVLGVVAESVASRK